MMQARLAAHVEVKALCRLTEAAGGFATVLRKGDEVAGVLLLQSLYNGANPMLWERIASVDGARQWARIWNQTIENKGTLDEYLARRIARDPDLWLIELDIADEQRLTALLSGVC